MKCGYCHHIHKTMPCQEPNCFCGHHTGILNPGERVKSMMIFDATTINGILDRLEALECHVHEIPPPSGVRSFPSVHQYTGLPKNITG